MESLTSEQVCDKVTAADADSLVNGCFGIPINFCTVIVIIFKKLSFLVITCICGILGHIAGIA